MRRTLSIFFFILGLATATFAQSDEFTPLPTIRVEKKVNLRRGPATTRSRARTLSVATELRVVDQNPSNGFYRVIFGKGRLGWVWSRNTSPPDAGFATMAPPGPAAATPCPSTFTRCEPEGCGTPGSNQALLNTVKRRMPSATTARTLTFASLRSLQQKANNLVGQHNELTQAERDSLVNLSISGGTVREGRLVKLSGFLAEGLEPHANSGGESVNCRLTGDAHNDFHISVVENPGDDEFKSVVVEMIPQGRNSGWTLAKLKNIRQQGKRILVIGALFYDNIHLVNDDASHPIEKQPKRFSLWEIHPITMFFVCTRATNNCSSTSTGATSGWKRLEDF
jgi:hypothetical protein